VQVVFTPLAERQIDRLHEHLTEVAGEARADAVVNRITAYCLGLDLFPKRGARRDDIIPGLRIIGFERRFAIAFVVTEELVLIEGVFQGGQDYQAAYRERGEE
jgi:toxin ParE1/3/4